MNDPSAVIRSIRKSGLPFLISTYGTGQETNTCREQYYRNCGYSEIVSIQDENGVRFVSPDGLSTIAYHPDYLQEIFTVTGLKVAIVHFSQIGVAFTSPELAKKIMPITFK